MASKKTGYDFWNDVLHSPRHVAAPMVDMSELAFRQLCRRYGAHLCYSPMLHSQQFVQDSLYRSDSFSTCALDRPLVVQFCANDPATFVEAALIVSDRCDAIDLNLGCPQAIAKKGHYGAFLQDEWGLIQSIVRKASSELPVPVTCKMRILPKPSVRSVEYARMLESSGCSALTVHGRTRFQKGHSTGLASWDVIKDIKDNVKIPVIANGNILNFDDVEACLNYTGADAVMSAEALLHNPALFSGRNPLVWEIAEEYLDLAEKYNTPVRHVRNHMYRILYLCLHQDSHLCRLLEDSSSYSDFHNVCDILKELPSKVIGDGSLENEDNELSAVFSRLKLSDISRDEFDLADLFTSFTVDCNSKEMLDTEHSSLCDMDAAAIVENLHTICKTLEADSADPELVKQTKLVVSETQCGVKQYLPIWVCHSRPRISIGSENRGSYSRYFSNSDEVKEKSENSRQEPWLSKRQQRKARHYARVLAAMKENRKAKKLRKKQKLLEQKENNYCEAKSKCQTAVSRKHQKEEIRQRMIDAQGTAPKVCIDLGFSSQMSEKELHRLSCQLRRLYGSNRHSEHPLHLYFCNFSDSDPLYKICVSKNDGFVSYIVDMVEESPEELFMASELVFLSPDSSNVLTDLDRSKVYVIGGIVDGSVKKGLTLGHAECLEIQTARLPILEHMERSGSKSGTTVLTVNQDSFVMLECLRTWPNDSDASVENFEFHQDLQQLKFIAYGVVGSTVVFFGLIGNLLNLVVLTRPCLQGITFTYLSWLAISDSLTLISGIVSLLRLQGVQPRTYAAALYYAHVELPAVNAFMACSVFLVVSVTVDRYFSVCHPTRFRDVHNKKWARKAILLAYVVSFLVYVPVGFEKRAVEHTNRRTGATEFLACENTSLVNNSIYKTYIMVKEVIVRLGPVVVLVVLNASIIVTFFRRRRKMMRRSSSFRKKLRDERRLIVLLATIVVIFFVCMTPAAILTILHTEEKDLLYDFQVFRAVANVLELCNYSLNFYIYCLCSPDIRSTLIGLFRKSEAVP